MLRKTYQVIFTITSNLFMIVAVWYLINGFDYAHAGFYMALACVNRFMVLDSEKKETKK